MGAIKLAIYPRTQIRKSDVARAISVPARITILKTIIEDGRTNGIYLSDVLKLSQPTIHHHLMVLKSTGLIKGDFFDEDYYWFLNYECEDELNALRWFLED
ncbi:winged helix-turn-helix transcriptional regulator [Fluviicola sp.]|uniref:ArsR/SmtB family transcription factor n=1 Tax=Fluviicola sp. TaxID=1917219 RepID=UPI0031CFCC4F